MNLRSFNSPNRTAHHHHHHYGCKVVTHYICLRARTFLDLNKINFFKKSHFCLTWLCCRCLESIPGADWTVDDHCSEWRHFRLIKDGLLEMTDCWVFCLFFICFSEDCLLVGTKPGHLLLYRIKNNAGKINKYVCCIKIALLRLSVNSH